MNKPDRCSAPTINFEGEEGKLRGLEFLREKSILGNGEGLDDLWDKCTVIVKNPGEALIHQGGGDCDIFFIICGSFEMIVNGRRISSRGAGDHIGEIGLLSPHERRTATAIALEDQSSVLQCPQRCFVHYAAKNPFVWERLARKLGDRLRARMLKVPMRRDVPNVLLFSTSEKQFVADAIKSGLDDRGLFPTVWSEGVVKPGSVTIDALREELRNSDYAVVILTAEDQTTSRGRKTASPRDNLALELGMSIGILGRKRTFIVKPRGMEIKIPTDVLGITVIHYLDDDNLQTIRSRVGSVCTTILLQVARLHAR